MFLCVFVVCTESLLYYMNLCLFLDSSTLKTLNISILSMKLDKYYLNLLIIFPRNTASGKNCF